MTDVSSSCCALLNVIGGLNVYRPNSSVFLATKNSYWSLQEASLILSCIVKPQTAEDVTKIISRITGRQECPFAIKSQGHAPAGGFGNIDHGITIDMTDLNTISINSHASVTSVGTGASWLDVYAFLDPYNKTVAGGRNGAVGVGGLTLGGGISYFSPQAGFTCDTVVNFQVVLSTGQLVDANATSHPDLFRALKGGMNNFGVVTRIDFKTLPISEILGGHLINDIVDRGAVFSALAGIADAEPYDIHASIVTSLILSSTTKNWTLLSAPIYTKPDLNPRVYEDLFAVPSVSNTMQVTPLHVLANESAMAQTYRLFSTTTFGVSAQLLDHIFDVCNETLHKFSGPKNLQWILSFEPLPTVLVSHGEGKNVLGTSIKQGSGSLVHTKVKEVLGEINGIAKKMGLSRDLVYANYAGTWQNPIASYSKENDQLLKDVVRRYDPQGIFQHQEPGGFKLSK